MDGIAQPPEITLSPLQAGVLRQAKAGQLFRSTAAHDFAHLYLIDEQGRQTKVNPRTSDALWFAGAIQCVEDTISAAQSNYREQVEPSPAGSAYLDALEPSSR